MMVRQPFLARTLVLSTFLCLASAFTFPRAQIYTKSPLIPQPSIARIQHLHHVKNGGDGESRLPSLLRLRQKTKAVRKWTRRSRWMSKVRQFTVALFAAVFLWFSAGGYRPARAVSVSLPNIEKILPSASLDQMVDRYVKDHMFDDDVYDPVESAFRETYEDVTIGKYPAALKDITAGILGKDAVSERREGENVVIGFFQRASGMLTKYFGIPEKVAQVVLAVTAFAASFFSFVSVFGTISYVIKSGMRREMKRRYGDDFTMDASDIKDPGEMSFDDDKKPDDKPDDSDGDDDDEDDDE